MNENIDVQITELRADILATLSEEMATIREEIEEAVSAVIPEPEKDPDEAEKEKNVDGDIIPDTDVDGDAIIDLDDGEENEIIYADYTVEDKLRLDELYDALSGVDLSSLKRAATDIEQAAISEEQELVLDDILASLDALVVSPVENDEKAGLILSILEDEFSTPLEAAPVVIELNQIKEHLRSMAEPLDSSEDDPEGETDTFGPKLVTALETIIGDDDLTVDNINSVAEDFDAAITELVPDEEFRSRLVSIITDEEHQREAYNPRSARLNNIRKRLVEIVGNEDDVVDAMERIDDIIDAFMDTSVVNNIKDSVTALFGEGADPLDVIRDEIPETTPEEVEAEIKLLSEEDTGEETDDTPIDEVVPEESEYDEDEEAHEDAPRTDSDLSTLINAKFQEVAERYDCLITLLNVDQFITDFREEIQNEITEAQFEAVENIIRNRVLENFSYQQIYDINSSIAGTIMDHFAARHIYAETIDTIKLNFKEAAGNTMTLQNLRSQLATFESVTTGLLTTEQMDAAKATIREAVIDKLYVNTLNAKLAIIEHAIIEQADIKYAAIEDLDAATGRIGTLETDMATANTLIAGKANIDLANVNNAWIENGVVKDAAISDAQIIGVSANKLTAGTIDASNITVTNLNADNITAGTLNGQRIGQGSLSLDKLNEAVYTEAEVDAKLNTMQQEIDGAIETFTGDVVPTLNNYPASGWSADDRSKHVGDVYYVVNAGNQADGYCYRFAYDNSTGTYGWVLIKDSDVTATLQRLIDAEGDIDDLQTFESNTSSWISNTDEELNSLKSRTTAVETGLGDKVSTSTFNELSQTVDENSSSITSLSTTVSKKANSSDVYTKGQTDDLLDDKADSSTVTTLSNTVNTVSQKADQNESKISNLTTTVESKADGTTVSALSTRVTDVEQDLSGFKTTVSETYYLASNPNGYTDDTAANAVAQNLSNNYSTTAQMTSAIEQSANSIISSVSETYATKTALNSKANSADVYTKTQTDGLLGDKADSSDVTSLSTRVTTAETTISQHTDSIALKANASEVYTKDEADDLLDGKASTASLELKANKATLTSEINASADTVKINADRVNIEGAAIFTGSGRLSTTSLNNTYAGVNDIPTDVSELNNDSGFITSADVPTKVSELQNDSGYQNSTQVSTTVNNAVAAVDTGLGIKWNTDKFAGNWNAGEAYFCHYDSSTGAFTDANGWVMFNGIKRTVPKGMKINQNTIIPFNRRVYIVLRLSSATATTGTMYYVYYDSGWKSTYPETPTTDNIADWTWAVETDIVLCSYVQTANELALVDYEQYTPVRTAQQVTNGDNAYIKAANAQTTANNAAPKTSAVKRTQRIYYQNNSTTAPSTPGTASSNWITDNTGDSGKWTKKRMSYSSTNKYIWTCEQSETVSGAVSYTTVLLDDSTTVIDGGNIITGTVTANKLNAPDINASKSLTVGAMTDAAAATILNSNIQIGGRNMLYDTNTPTIDGSFTGCGVIYWSNANTLTTNGTGTEWTALPDTPVSGVKYGAHHVCTQTGGRNHLVSFYSGYDKVRFVAGETYTMSFWAKSNVAGAQVQADPTNGSYVTFYTDRIFTISETNTWQKFVVTFKWLGNCPTTVVNGETMYNNVVYMGFAYNVVGEVWCCAYKIEQGNQATDWCDYVVDYSNTGGRNLLHQTGVVDLTGNSTKPNINGYYNDGSTMYGEIEYPSASNASTTSVGNGIRTELLNNTTYPFFRFGTATTNASTIARAEGLYGLEAGETYTLTADVSVKAYSGYSATNIAYLQALLFWDNGAETSWTVYASKYWFIWYPGEYGAEKSGRRSFTFTIPSTAKRIYLIIRPNGTTSGYHLVDDYLELRNMKLEKGNKATDWTPAPEDVDADISDAAKTATNYLVADETGIMVADLEGSAETPSTATTRNVYIDSDSVDIRNGQEVLASFGTETVIGDCESSDQLYYKVTNDSLGFSAHSIKTNREITPFSAAIENKTIGTTARSLDTTLNVGQLQLKGNYDDGVVLHTGIWNSGSIETASGLKIKAGTNGALANVDIESNNGGAIYLDGKTIFDHIYPVGSIYMSVNDTDPGVLFGGTWEPLKDRFLLAAGDTYSAGATGGAATHHHSTGNHTLTAAESGIRAHSHPHTLSAASKSLTGEASMFGDTGLLSGSFKTSGVFTYGTKWSSYKPQYASGGPSYSLKIDASHGHALSGSISNNTAGNATSAHNHGNTGDTSNMPPYLAVYMWKRTG